MKDSTDIVAAAEAAYDAGDVPRAHELLEEARRAGPPTARLFCDLGVVHAARGEPEAARAALERALALDPECDVARDNLAALGGSGDECAIRESLIVPAYGRPDAARRLVEDLCRQTVAASEFEVIVVDDGSPEPLSEVLAGIETPFELRILRQENAGPAAARNEGVRKARGDIVLFLNDDAVPAPDLIAAHRRARSTAPEHAAILGAFPYSPHARRSRFVRVVESKDLVFPFNDLRSDRPNDWIFFWTCNISVARADVVAVGGFDERFRHAMSEDIELGWRLQRDLGAVVVHAPDAVCHHEHSLTVEEFARRQYTMGWNHHMLFEKYENPAPLAIGGLGPFDERAFETLRKEVARERDASGRALGELAEWERQGTLDLSHDDIRRAVDLAWRVSATAFKRGVCERHFDPATGKTFLTREKNFLTPSDSSPRTTPISLGKVFVQVPV